MGRSESRQGRSDTDGQGAPAPPRLVYFINEDWFFCSHFLDRAVAARGQGFVVSVIARVESHGQEIRDCGLRLFPIKIGRRAENPITELSTILSVWRIYRAVRPTMVHHIALKPIIFGTIAARLAGVSRIVNAPVGMGFVFASDSALARALRPLLRVALRLLLNPSGSRVVFENPDDLSAAVADGLVRSQDAVLIRGAGVDLDRFVPVGEPGDGPPTVVLVARMLWEKGVGVFVEAAKRLRAKGVAARFLVVGDPDPGNPGSIPAEQLRAWHQEGSVEWLGRRTDVAEILARSAICCLPSHYGEGLPKSLLEGLAAGLPIVATDIPGCREAVIEGENGFLAPPRNPQALADALEKLLVDRELRLRFGARSRALAETNFGTAKVNEATIALYREMLTAG